MMHLPEVYARWRYSVLLITLLLVLVVQPISASYSPMPPLFDVLLVLVTAALLLSFFPDKNRRLLALVLGIPTGLLSLGGHFLAVGPGSGMIMIGHGLAVLFYFWAAGLIVTSLVRRAELSLDAIFGSICGYLLLGMAWGVLYSLLDTAWPGSFQISDALAKQVQAEHSRIHMFNYYSFVTLMTVGFGDLSPISPAARTCSWLEALTGQFYLAVLVAGLVGTFLSKKNSP